MTELRYSIAAALMCGATFTSADAAVDFRITEVYAGITGESGTRDWIEVTNLGDVAGDTGILLMDNDAPSLASAKSLPSFTLNPGESAVFLYISTPLLGSTLATAEAEFTSIWGAISNLGTANTGGIGSGFGQTGDVAYIGTDSEGSFAIIDSFAVSGEFSNSLTTLEDVSGVGTPRTSVLGENGAYLSAAFFNDNLGLPNNEAVLTGSPGAIPEPGSLALLGLSGVAILVRRRNRRHA